MKKNENEIDLLIKNMRTENLEDILSARDELKKRNDLSLELLPENDYKNIEDSIVRKSIEIEFLKMKKEMQAKTLKTGFYVLQ